MASDRKKRNREANVYPTSVRTNIIKESNYDNDELAAYGIYKDGEKWILAAMAIQRDIEELVSDRQGATKSKTRDKTIVTPTYGSLLPEDGVEIGKFSTKKEAMQEITAESSTRLGTGNYVVKLSDWSRGMKTHKVDRDKFGEFLRQESTSRVR